MEDIVKQDAAAPEAPQEAASDQLEALHMELESEREQRQPGVKGMTFARFLLDMVIGVLLGLGVYFGLTKLHCAEGALRYCLIWGAVFGLFLMIHQISCTKRVRDMAGSAANLAAQKSRRSRWRQDLLNTCHEFISSYKIRIDSGAAQADSAAPSEQKKPAAAPAALSEQKKPAAAPSASSAQKKPAAAPAAPSAQKKPATAPAAPSAQKKPAAAPAASSAQKKPATAPAAPSAQKKPAAAPAASSAQKKPAVTAPAAPSAQKKPAAAPAASSAQKKPAAASAASSAQKKPAATAPAASSAQKKPATAPAAPSAQKKPAAASAASSAQKKPAVSREDQIRSMSEVLRRANSGGAGNAGSAARSEDERRQSLIQAFREQMDEMNRNRGAGGTKK